MLSEETDVADLSLAQIAAAITEGDCSGAIEHTVVELSAPEAARALLAQGSDPEFFMLDEDGAEIEL